MSCPGPRCGLAVLLVAVTVSGQSAWSAPLGRGCSGQPVGMCLRQNDVLVQLPATTLSALHAYPATNTTGAAIQVVGLEVFAVNYSWATENVGVFLFADASGSGALVHTQPATTPTAGGFVQVAATPAWCSTGLDRGVLVPAGGVFWIGHEAFRGNSASENLLGTLGTVPTWTRTSGPWSSLGPTRPAFRVWCTAAAPLAPALSLVGLPRQGQSFTLVLDRGTPLAPAVLLWGGNSASWNGVPLPLDLTAAGALDCLLYTRIDYLTFLALDNNGMGSVAVFVSNDPALLGRSFRNQALIVTPGRNPLHAVFTNATLGYVGI